MTATTNAPQKKPQAAWIPALMIGLRLLLICAVVAGIISFVYAVTKPKAEANLRETKRIAISDIFGMENPDFDEDNGFYTVRDASGTVGYCVESTAAGFGGDLTLMVGYSADGTIRGVRIVSHSETPGLGARVKDDPAHLGQYTGKSGTLKLNKDGGTDVDAISGATISSRAVNQAVNQATDVLTKRLAATSGGDAQ